MFPLRDNIPPRSAPVVNYVLIALTTVMFFMQLRDQTDGQDHLIERLALVPARVLHPENPITVQYQIEMRGDFGIRQQSHRRPMDPPLISPWATVVTCIFLHGGWMHFLGNMWFLHIFGDNVEDRLGHVGYFFFYVGCGVAASLLHLFVNATSTTPTIGASGAIAGVMGAYFRLYPRARVLTLVPILLYLEVLVLPASVFLGIWFLIQFFSGTFAVTAGAAAGVAWWAHIGGFIAGYLVARTLYSSGHLNPPVVEVLPRTERFTHYPFREPRAP
jgi:membrane associated rhomboid family serine protease